MTIAIVCRVCSPVLGYFQMTFSGFCCVDGQEEAQGLSLAQGCPAAYDGAMAWPVWI